MISNGGVGFGKERMLRVRQQSSQQKMAPPNVQFEAMEQIPKVEDVLASIDAIVNKYEQVYDAPKPGRMICYCGCPSCDIGPFTLWYEG